MGDRFYQQQLETLGTCPGSKSTTKRKRKVAWDDDKKAAVVAAYEEANPTPETSMEIVKVYVKKTPAAGSGTSSSGGSGGSRVSKAAAQETLIAALTDAGVEIDNDIVEKLTGKAAQYFAGVITQVAS